MSLETRAKIIRPKNRGMPVLTGSEKIGYGRCGRVEGFSVCTIQEVPGNTLHTRSKANIVTTDVE